MGLSETRVPQHHMVYNKLSLWKIAILRIYTPLSDTSIWILPPFFPPMASFGSGSVAQVGTQGHREFLHAIIQIAGGVSHPLPVTPWRQWLRQWLCLIQWVVYTNNGAIFIGETGETVMNQRIFRDSLFSDKPTNSLGCDVNWYQEMMGI